jgi:hypothetical protein
MEEFVRYDIPMRTETPKVRMMEPFDAHVNRNSKDSIFCDLFSRPEYCLQLYQVLHPEDKEAKAENITLVTLSSLMMRNRYNDLGILVRDRLLVLVEAQSTFTKNILIRFLLYLGDTYNRYITKENLNIYGTKDVKLPIPELYVIYHGERGNKPDEITLSRDIFGIDDPENIFVDVKAKIIYASTPGDIIDQFINFARVFDEQIQKYGRTREAVEETLRKCRNKDVLKDYLAKEEAATIMFTLLDEQKARKFWEEELRQEGEARGEARGEAKGEAKLGSLMTKLKKLGRTDDAFRAASNEAYRNQLYRELNIQ